MNAIGIGGGVSAPFLQNMVYPQPWDSSPGFYVYADDFQDFQAEIKEKLAREIGSPQIDIEKSTNGLDSDTASGQLILVGDTVTWSYNITNNGTVNLTNIEFLDYSTGFNYSIDKLEPGEWLNLTDTGIAMKGPYSNLANVTAEYNEVLVNDSDPSCYFGADPSVDIEKSTNGEDADEAPGPYIRLNYEVVWEFNVTNTGNVNLTDIEVTDDELGLIGIIELLQPGESCVLNESGTASLGQYENNATAVGVAPIGPNVTDSDMSHYFGHDSQPNFEVPTANPLLIIGMLGLAGAMVLRREQE